MKDNLLVSPLAVVFAAAIKLFAQQQPGGNVDASIGNLVGNLGMMGVLVWYLWYHTTRTYPEMQRNFQGESQQLRAAFKEEQQSSRDAFLREQAASRQSFLEEQAKLRESFLREQKDSRDHDERMQAELRQLFVQTAQSFRVAVHDVKDTAQVAINRQNLAEVRAEVREQTKDHGKGKDDQSNRR